MLNAEVIFKKVSSGNSSYYNYISEYIAIGDQNQFGKYNSILQTNLITITYSTLLNNYVLKFNSLNIATASYPSTSINNEFILNLSPSDLKNSPYDEFSYTQPTTWTIKDSWDSVISFNISAEKCNLETCIKLDFYITTTDDEINFEVLNNTYTSIGYINGKLAFKANTLLSINSNETVIADQNYIYFNSVTPSWQLLKYDTIYNSWSDFNIALGGTNNPLNTSDIPYGTIQYQNYEVNYEVIIYTCDCNCPPGFTEINGECVIEYVTGTSPLNQDNACNYPFTEDTSVSPSVCRYSRVTKKAPCPCYKLINCNDPLDVINSIDPELIDLVNKVIEFQGKCYTVTQSFDCVNNELVYSFITGNPFQTCSECNSGAVISRSELKEKRAMGGPLFFPKFALLDPTFVATLPKRQLANGIIDAYTHTMEQYLTFPGQNKVQERFAEGILATLIEIGPGVLENPADYELAAHLMYAANQALNGMLRCGVTTDWVTHMIGHELTALHGIDHAQTLAIIAPRLYENQFENKKAMLAQYGKRVWQLTGDDTTIAREAIVKTEAFFHSLGVKTRISDYAENCQETPAIIKQRFQTRNWVAMGEKQAITPDDVEQIVKNAI
jgi:NADP-dependent alcohol dehydrogenase